MASHKLTCQQLVEWVTDYLERTLSLEDQMRFESHMSDCSGCAAYLDQMRHTIHLTHRLSGDSIPDDALADLLNAFRGWKTGDWEDSDSDNPT